MRVSVLLASLALPVLSAAQVFLLFPHPLASLTLFLLVLVSICFPNHVRDAHPNRTLVTAPRLPSLPPRVQPASLPPGVGPSQDQAASQAQQVSRVALLETQLPLQLQRHQSFRPLLLLSLVQTAVVPTATRQVQEHL